MSRRFLYDRVLLSVCDTRRRCFSMFLCSRVVASLEGGSYRGEEEVGTAICRPPRGGLPS